MTNPPRSQRSWEERLGAWLGARWRWLLAAVLILFAINSFAGLAAGALGLLAFGHRLAGQLLGAQRAVQQVRQIVGDSDDPREEL